MEMETYTLLATENIENVLLEETKYLKNCCRLCLSQNQGVSIFSDYQDSLKFSEIAMLLTNIKIETDDNLTKNICQECSSKLILFYKFKQKCEISNCTLLALIDSFSTDSKSDQDIEFIVVDGSPKGNESLEIEDKISKEFNEPSTELIHFDDKILTNQENKMHHIIIDKEVENTQLLKINDKITKEDNVYNVGINTINNDKKIHHCDECGKVFQRRTTLNQHLTTHSSEKKFSCDICHKKFTRKGHVQIHMRRHNNVKPYICDICNRGFTKSSDLYRHKKIHSDVKDYVCEICGKAFKRGWDLSSHMHSHTGNRPYKCKKCEKAYTSHSSMMKHCRKFGHC